MAKKTNSKVSITKVDAYLKSQNRGTATVSVEYGEDQVLEFEVKQFVSLAEFYDMVQTVAKASFVVDEETGLETYDAVYELYATKIAMLTYVANFKDDMSSEKLFQLAQDSKVMDLISHHWNWLQHNQFQNVVADQIEYKQKELLATERRMLQMVTDQVENAAQSMMQFNEVFAKIDPQVLAEDMHKVSNMSELELGKAVVAARDPDFVEQRNTELQVLK